MGITCKMNGGKNEKGFPHKKYFLWELLVNWTGKIYNWFTHKKNYMGITCKMDLDQI